MSYHQQLLKILLKIYSDEWSRIDIKTINQRPYLIIGGEDNETHLLSLIDLCVYSTTDFKHLEPKNYDPNPIIRYANLDLKKWLIQRVEYLHSNSEQKLCSIVPFFNPYFDKKGKNWHYLCVIDENKVEEINVDNSVIEQILPTHINIGDQIFEGEIKFTQHRYHLGALIGIIGYSILAYYIYKKN